MNISKQHFGKTDTNDNVDLYKLTNNNGMVISITNYGGIITSLTSKNKQGTYEDIVLGYDNLDDYKKSSPYFGSIVGRYSNRIADGKFTINTNEYTLAKNNDGNSLHGGLKGFDKVLWTAKENVNKESVVLELNYLSIDGEEGFPGNLDVTVKYTLTNNDELVIEYFATTDKLTHICLTNHSYFNLSANFNNNILDHELWLNADSFLPISQVSIPIGNVESVINTPFDFNKKTKIGDRINENNKQIQNGNGYDHCMIFSDYDGQVKLQGKLYNNSSGRLMEMYTSEPGVQLYTGNFLDGSYLGKDDIRYNRRTGVCLETEHFPDSPNHSNFPSTLLEPGSTYSTTTIYKFKVI